MNFYEKYIALCEERGIDPSPAAIRAGFSKSAVSKWKSDPALIPTNRTIEKLCAYFHVDRSYFFDEKEEDAMVLTGLSDEDKLLIRLVLAAPDDVKQSIKLLLQRASRP